MNFESEVADRSMNSVMSKGSHSQWFYYHTLVLQIMAVQEKEEALTDL